MNELQRAERRVREEILDGFLWKLMIAHQKVLNENAQLRAEIAAQGEVDELAGSPITP